MSVLREARFEISYVVLAVGAFLAILAALNAFLAGGLPAPITDILNAIGNWIVWFVVLGPLLTLVGGWYFLDTIRKQREFKRLADVPSKAHFVRNQERLEELVWYLSSDYQRTLQERKRRWGL